VIVCVSLLKPASPVSSTRTISHEEGAAGTIDVSNEVGDSSVDCQSYLAFVIEGRRSSGPKHHLERLTLTQADLFLVD
jgi:hypothetical protein